MTASSLACLATVLVSGWAVVARADPIAVASASRSSGYRADGDGWKPVRDSKPHAQLRLPPPTSAYYMELGVHNKYFRVDPSPSNKVEVFAPAPPSILGSFSGFGHDTIKSRHPVKHKKPFKDTLHQSESRPGYTQAYANPYRHAFAQPFKHSDNVGQAYYFEASLSPPPRESAINLVPPPNSKAIAPNSYYFQQVDQTRTKSPPTYSPYLRQSLPIYAASDYIKSTIPSTDPYRYYSPDPPSKVYNSRPTASHTTNSHGRPPGIDYFGSNPFGDIHLNTNKPDTKTPAKDIFDQLSHLGRPFQSSTIDPPRISSQSSLFSSIEPVNYYSTSGNFARQTTPKPFRPSPLVVDPFQSTERPSLFVTPGPSPPSRDIYSIPVTTLDIPSRDEVYNKPSPIVNTYQSIPETQQYLEEVTGKPTKSSILSTYQSVPETQQYHEEVSVKPTTTSHYRRPEVEVNTNGESLFQPTPFLPTPTTDVDQYVGEPSPTDLITPSSETNEVHKPTRTRTSRPRYRKKKPVRKPETNKFVESTSDDNLDSHINEYTVANEENPKLTTYESISNTYQTEQFPAQESEKFEEAPKRRRPLRPTHQSTSTFTNTETDIQEIPTAISALPEEEIKTSPPTSTTTGNNHIQNRRRKKPEGGRNRVRGSVRHGARSTTTTTAEPPQEITNDFISNTEYQPQKETFQTENYPISGLAFNEYGHIMPQVTDEYHANTLFPTQQVDDYQTIYHEPVSSSTTSEPTTTSTTTTTPEPETSSLTTTSKTRLRNRYNFNNTRPRFSVKDYRERLNKATSTTTETPKEETSEQNESLRIRPPRLRGNISYKPENQDEKVDTSTRRFKPKYTGQRHAYRTSTTQSPLLQLDTPTTTERQNTFRPSSIRRPNANKYYSRYRTSTESPTASAADQPSTEKEKLPVRPKGVFSAKKRRPFPLRTRNEDNEEENAQNQHTDNDLDNDQYITKKSDNIATTTLMTSSEEADWNSPSSERPVSPSLDSTDHGDITKKIADLTSSPSNAFDSSGFFKGVSPSSRRTVSHITLATEDPILPIEAFFSSSLNKNVDSR